MRFFLTEKRHLLDFLENPYAIAGMKDYCTKKMSDLGNLKSNSFREQLLDVSVCAIAVFLFAGAFKLRLLTPRGFEVVASQIPGGHLSLFQKALLFSGEAWECFVFLPLLLLGVG